MSMVASGIQAPSSCRGMLQIVRYNRGMYLRALAVLGATCLALSVIESGWMSVVLWIGISLTLFWSMSSLLVAHYVYDRSRLAEWTWIARLVPKDMRRWIQIHAGIDETHGSVHECFARIHGSVLDIFDALEMTESSIHRARALSSDRFSAIPAGYAALPLANDSIDVVFAVFAIHELRARGARERLLSELGRCLRPGGRVVLVEHGRDWINALAFGPGVFHFFSTREWLRNGRAAGLACAARFQITPFVICVVWEKTQ